MARKLDLVWDPWLLCVSSTGSEILLAKLKEYQPRIAVFNGKGIYEIFSGKKQFNFGKQPEMVDGTNTVSMISSE